MYTSYMGWVGSTQPDQNLMRVRRVNQTRALMGGGCRFATHFENRLVSGWGPKYAIRPELAWLDLFANPTCQCSNLDTYDDPWNHVIW